MNIEQINAGSALLIDALWRASWQGTLAVILVWIMCRALPKISPRVRSWLWRLVILKFIFTLLWLAPLELRIFRATILSPPPALTHTINSAQVASALDNSVVLNSPTQLSEKTVSHPIPVSPSFAWQSILAALWITGVLLATSRLLWQFVQARKLRTIAT